MRRVTVRFDDQLLLDAKRLAARTGRSLTRVIEDALREALGRGGSGARRRRPIHLTTARGKLRPGIDLESNAAVRDVMDGLGDAARGLRDAL